MHLIDRQIGRISNEDIRQVARDFARRLHELGEITVTDDERWLIWFESGESVVFNPDDMDCRDFPV